ncbi:hypothetical protein BOW51_07730, partial [Solemya velesiana gill symbiont]
MLAQLDNIAIFLVYQPQGILISTIKTCNHLVANGYSVFVISNAQLSENRPAVVDRGTGIGDWEGDTVIGKGRKSALLTMVERKTLYTVIV